MHLEGLTTISAALAALLHTGRLDQRTAAVIAGVVLPPWRMLDRYRSYLLEDRHREQRTWLEYRRTLLDFWAHAGKPPDRIRRQDLHRFLYGRKLAPATRTTYAHHIKGFYGWAARTGLLPADPLAGYYAPPAPHPPPRALDGSDVERLIASAYNDEQLWLMVWLAYGAGLRCMEVAGLRIEDCRLHGPDPEVYVHGKGRRDRVVPLHPLVARAVAVRLEGRPTSGPVVESRASAGEHVGAKHVSRRLCEALQSLRRPDGSRVQATAHQLRHTFATEILAAGEGRNLHAVARLLGDTVATTERYVSAYDADAIASVRAWRPRPRHAHQDRRRPMRGRSKHWG